MTGIFFRFSRTLVPVVAAFVFVLPSWSAAGEPTNVRFQRKQLDGRFRSEGVAVGDFNHDGKPDIAAGFVWYEAPDWKMHVISPEPPSDGGTLAGLPPHYEPKGYSNSFCNFAEDLDGDGWTDLIVIDFPGKPTWWFENPKKPGTPWKKQLVTPVTNNESPTYLDLDGDGKRELIAAFSPDPANTDGPDRQMAFFKPAQDPRAPWSIQAISEKGAPGCQRYSHGLGLGDVNKDGRTDVLCAEGWWEAPKGSLASEWKFHKAPFGGGTAQLYVDDFDGDGDNDVLGSSPHAFGIWWFEQLPGGQWKTNEIDKSVSQTHGVCVADINGDGLMDFVTGKRWWAHAAGDPGVDDPAIFCWFELTRQNGRPVWQRHQFDDDSGPGTQFEIADVNQDGLPDIVTSSKKGVYYFEQIRDAK